MKVNPLSPTLISDKSEFIDTIIDCIRDIKGKRIVTMDMRQLDDAPTDFFIICEGESSTQVSSIAQHINSRIRKEYDMRPNHLEGLKDARWVLVDYFDIVVHVFYPEARVYYDLEDFWSDAIIHNHEEDL